MTEIHALLNIGPSTNLWTGTEEITFDSRTYIGMGSVLEIGTVEAATDVADTRLELVLGTIPTALRAQFLQDAGPLSVTLRFARVTRDSGTSPTISALPTLMTGKLSTAQMREGILRVEVETVRGDVDRGLPQMWSDQDQQSRSPGDRFFEHMRALANQGIDVAWPP